MTRNKSQKGRGVEGVLPQPLWWSGLRKEFVDNVEMAEVLHCKMPSSVHRRHAQFECGQPIISRHVARQCPAAGGTLRDTARQGGHAGRVRAARHRRHRPAIAASAVYAARGAVRASDGFDNPKSTAATRGSLLVSTVVVDACATWSLVTHHCRYASLYQ